MTTTVPQIISYSRIDPLKGKSIYVDEGDNLEIFDIKRIYWIAYNTPQKTSSEHAHKTLEQIIIAINGQVEISLEDKNGIVSTYKLDNPGQGLYIPPLHWKRIHYSQPCTLLCLASEMYNEDDYIRDYGTFRTFEIV